MMQRYIPNYELINYERPETVIARQIPKTAMELLERISKRKYYKESLGIGKEIVNTCVSRMSKHKLINFIITIEPRASLGGFFGFGKSEGMVVSFREEK